MTLSTIGNWRFPTPTPSFILLGLGLFVSSVGGKKVLLGIVDTGKVYYKNALDNHSGFATTKIEQSWTNSCWQDKTCGLYYKSFMIVIYDRNDSMIIIYNRNDSGLYYKAIIIAR
jgi:hypothetical protein